MAGQIQIFMCQSCRHVFKLPVSEASIPETKAECPECHSDRVEIMTSWAPIGFTSQNGTQMWDYECQRCRKTFRLPVPTSPSQEKEARCPACGESHIHRLTPASYQPLYCG